MQELIYFQALAESLTERKKNKKNNTYIYTCAHIWNSDLPLPWKLQKERHKNNRQLNANDRYARIICIREYWRVLYVTAWPHWVMCCIWWCLRHCLNFLIRPTRDMIWKTCMAFFGGNFLDLINEKLRPQLGSLNQRYTIFLCRDYSSIMKVSWLVHCCYTIQNLHNLCVHM